MIRNLFLLISLVMSFSSAFAEGASIRGGGNAFEPEFKQIGRDLVTDIKQAGLTSDQMGFEVIRLEIATQEIRVIGTDGALKIENYPRQAINNPKQKLILFSNSTWAILNPYQKKLLVLHEYLRFVGVDDSEYAFSLRIIQLLKNPNAVSNHTPRPSARAKVYFVYASQGQLLAWDGHSETAYGIKCECRDGWMLLRSNQSVPGFIVDSVNRYFESSACWVARQMLYDATPSSPVKIILDPVRALDSPNDYLTIAY